MKKLAIFGGIVVLLAAAGAYEMKAHTFAGEITDGTCANNGVHVMSSPSDNDSVEAKRKCTIGCVKLGETYVLYNAATKDIYDLSDQTTPELYAGEKVLVFGTLDKARMMIHVRGIHALS